MIIILCVSQYFNLSLGGTNDFVEIGFIPDTLTLTCRFIGQSLGFAQECLINITYGDDCEEQLDIYTSDHDSDTGLLVTPRIDLVDGVSRYCYFATATSGNTIVIIEGIFNLFEVNVGKTLTIVAINFTDMIIIMLTLYTGITAAATVVPAVLIICIFVALISTILLWQRYKTSIVIIHFSNVAKIGSLASMLRVFKVGWV